MQDPGRVEQLGQHPALKPIQPLVADQIRIPRPHNVRILVLLMAARPEQVLHQTPHPVPPIHRGDHRFAPFGSSVATTRSTRSINRNAASATGPTAGGITRCVLANAVS
jgi:hypothetical protein